MQTWKKNAIISQSEEHTRNQYIQGTQVTGQTFSLKKDYARAQFKVVLNKQIEPVLRMTPLKVCL